MTKVFIGGSRRVTRLSAEVQRRIDKIIEQGFPILVGDVNGADKAVQTYLRDRHYRKVDVFCAGGRCRNNVGDWPPTNVPVRYQYARNDRHRFTSFSMAKTVTAMLIGIAIAEGRIRSADDLAAAYVPALAGTEYGGTSLRHLLEMSSGVRFIENYSGRDDAARLWIDTVIQAGAGGVEAVKPYNERLRRSGYVFSYASVETQVLGLVLRGAVGRPVADYLRETIWEPMGAEADATWLIDRAGQEATYCCLNAVLRDYARVGLLLAHDGRLGDRQIIPEAWVQAATTVPADSWHLKPYAATRYFGYGYQTWIFPGKRRMFALLGLHGQAIFVDPSSRLVMVHTAVRKEPAGPNAEAVALWRGVVNALGGPN